MPRFLSWKDKFRALIAVSLISLAAMVGAALWINERLGGSFEAQRAATSFRGETLDLLNDWLRVGAQRRGLRPETSERYAGQLAEIERQAAALGENASRLGDPALLRQPSGSASCCAPTPACNDNGSSRTRRSACVPRTVRGRRWRRPRNRWRRSPSA